MRRRKKRHQLRIQQRQAARKLQEHEAAQISDDTLDGQIHCHIDTTLEDSYDFVVDSSTSAPSTSRHNNNNTACTIS